MKLAFSRNLLYTPESRSRSSVLAGRYGSFAEYRKHYAAACAELVRRRLLLPDEADRLIAGREKVRAVFLK